MNDQFQAPLGQPDQKQNPVQQTPTQNRQPEDAVRDGNIKGTIWKREGKNYDFFTTDFAKTYKDKSENLKDTHSFNKDDLLRVAEVARRAHSRVTASSREEFVEKQRNNHAPQRDR